MFVFDSKGMKKHPIGCMNLVETYDFGFFCNHIFSGLDMNYIFISFRNEII
jgi:hypothetical protein